MWFSAIKLAISAGSKIYANKQKAKMAMSDAQLLHAERQARGEEAYQGKLLEARQSDWKDEAVLIILSLPVLVLAWAVISDDPSAMEKVKQFFDYLGTTVEINKENLSLNFWSTSSMMAPFYELLQTLSSWLNSKGINKMDAQKYITSLFIALSEDAKVNAKKDLKILVKNSQTPRGLNEQAVNELRKSGFFKSLNITTNSVLKRLKK